MYEFARVVCEQEPPLPSTAVAATPEATAAMREASTVRLKRRLTGDLDNILLKALRKEPAERYGSVEQFSEDVRRHLETLPVMARQNTFWYSAGKLIRRHPAGASTAALIAFSIVLGFGTLLWSTRMAIEERLQSPQPMAPGEHAPQLSYGSRILTAFETQLYVRTVLAPQFLIGYCLMLMILAGAIYLTRAPVRRVGGALAGGVLFTSVYLWVNQFASSMGWRRSIYSSVRDPMALLPKWILLCHGTCSFAVLILIGWRVGRRFGWKGQALFTIAIAIFGTSWDRLLGVAYGMVTVPGALPYAADGATWGLGTIFALGLMRIVAGPPEMDRLAKGSSLASQRQKA
jgi:hypothetical protein